MNISYKHFEILKELFQIQDNSFLNKILDLVKEHRRENEVEEEDDTLQIIEKEEDTESEEWTPMIFRNVFFSSPTSIK